MLDSNVTHIFFDLGETLFQPLPEQVAQENLISVAQSDSSHESNARIIQVFDHVKRKVADEFRSRSFYYHGEFVRESCRRAFRELKIRNADELAAIYCEKQRKAVIELLTPQPECWDVLNDLHASGYVIAIISNIDNDWIEPLAEKWNLAEHVSLILSSETARSCKPDSGIFLEACRKLDCDPSQVVFVGDSEENDIAGAKRLGMFTARFDTSGTSPTQANRSISNLTELLT